MTDTKSGEESLCACSQSAGGMALIEGLRSNWIVGELSEAGSVSRFLDYMGTGSINNGTDDCAASVISLRRRYTHETGK